MGRRRQSHEWLPTRLYFHHGAYYFAPPSGSREHLGSDYPRALARYAKLVGRPGPINTMGQLIDSYLLERAPLKAKRTYLDNLYEARYLKPFFEHLEPREVTPRIIYLYKTERQEASVRCNRELALLSKIMQLGVERGLIDDNPVKRVERNPELARTRYVYDWEIDILKGVASEKIRAYVDFKYLTGLRKGDILRLMRSDLTADGILVKPSKNKRRHPRTGKLIQQRVRLFSWTPELEEVVARIKAVYKGAKEVQSLYLFCNRKGLSYYNTEKGKCDGFDAIWKRYLAKARPALIAKALELRLIDSAEEWQSFTDHDIRAKAGSDAKNAGQAGHELLGNTEKQFNAAYRRGTEIVVPLKKK
jgi:integrase